MKIYDRGGWYYQGNERALYWKLEEFIGDQVVCYAKCGSVLGNKTVLNHAANA